MGEPQEILEAERTVAERYPHLNVVRSSDILCEVMAADASKSNAVQVISAHCGVDLACAVAFGDGPNDLDMLLSVPNSYAMANAEGGVARMLEQLVLG